MNFSYIRWNPAEHFADSLNLFGGGGDVTYFLSEYFGFKAEFTGYGSQNTTITFPEAGGPGIFTASGNMFTYLFGPVVKKRSGYFQPYGHLLLGGAHTNLYTNINHEGGNISPDSNAFAMAVGGGLDVKLSRLISVRLAEADYFLTHFPAHSSTNGTFGTNQNNFRLQTGIVFSF